MQEQPEQPEQKIPRVLVVDDQRNQILRMAKELGLRLKQAEPRDGLVVMPPGSPFVLDSMLYMEELDRLQHARLHHGLDVLHITRDEPLLPRSFFPSDEDLKQMAMEISKTMRAQMPIMFGTRIKAKIPRKLKKKLKKQGLY